jgi:hypothetical protein
LKRWFVGSDAFCPHSTAISRGFSEILNDLDLTKIASNGGPEDGLKIRFPVTLGLHRVAATDRSPFANEYVSPTNTSASLGEMSRKRRSLHRYTVATLVFA